LYPFSASFFILRSMPDGEDDNDDYAKGGPDECPDLLSFASGSPGRLPLIDALPKVDHSAAFLFVKAIGQGMPNRHRFGSPLLDYHVGGACHPIHLLFCLLSQFGFLSLTSCAKDGWVLPAVATAISAMYAPFVHGHRPPCRWAAHYTANAWGEFPKIPTFSLRATCAKIDHRLGFFREAA
jgi:hypothetical protein